jgi:hypothetical protein
MESKKKAVRAVPRKMITEFCGMKIVAQVTYLGMHITPTNATTITAAKLQV